MDTKTKSMRRRTVLLTLTEACNLNCSYCYQDHKSPQRMIFETARSALERVFAGSPDHDEIEIDLFGGEPFLCFDLIERLYAWLISEKRQKPYLVFITTNGTLVHDRIQEWLLANKERVYVGLSVDGTPATQNTNRSGSYSSIDFSFFARNYPEQPVRMTISPQRAASLYEDILHLHSLGFQVTATFAHGVKWRPEHSEIVATQLRLLADYYLQHPEGKACSLFSMNLISLVRKPSVKQRYCGTGHHMVSVAADGQEYPCQLFQPNSMSAELRPGSERLRDSTELFHDEECRNCVIDGVCPTCYGMNLKLNGDMHLKCKDSCGIYRLLAQANAYYTAERIKTDTLTLSPGDMLDTVKAIDRLRRAA